MATPWELVMTGPSAFAGHAGVFYNNRAVSIGGFDGTGAPLKIVAGSRTGRNPEPVITNPTGLSVRCHHAAAVFNERVFVTGGYAGGSLSDSLFSENLKDWETLKSDCEWAPNGGLHGHQMVAFNTDRQRLVIVGGGYYNQVTIPTNRVWMSVDGKTWEEPPLKTSIWSARAWHRSLVYNNRLWVMGGADVNNNHLSDVWYTEDLEHWVRALEVAPWGPLAAFGCCVYDQRMWVIGGASLPDEQRNVYPNPHVWFSRNGVDWVQAFDMPASLYYCAAIELDNRIHVFGGRDNTGNVVATVYRMNMG